MLTSAHLNRNRKIQTDKNPKLCSKRNPTPNFACFFFERIQMAHSRYSLNQHDLRQTGYQTEYDSDVFGSSLAAAACTDLEDLKTEDVDAVEVV